jgi:hypothetical protein
VVTLAGVTSALRSLTVRVITFVTVSTGTEAKF